MTINGISEILEEVVPSFGARLSCSVATDPLAAWRQSYFLNAVRTCHSSPVDERHAATLRRNRHRHFLGQRVVQGVDQTSRPYGAEFRGRRRLWRGVRALPEALPAAEAPLRGAGGGVRVGVRGWIGCYVLIDSMLCPAVLTLCFQGGVWQWTYLRRL